MPKDLLTVDWRTLIHHSGSVPATETLGAVHETFSLAEASYLAVLENGQPVGLCSRDQVGMKLGSRYGFPLFAKAPVSEHLLPEPLRVKVDEALNVVLPRVFARTGGSFGEDVMLLDEVGRYLGLIDVQTLVRLQSRLFLRSIEELEQKQADIDRRNRQMTEELRIARELQLALLPRPVLSFPDGEAPRPSKVRVVSRYVPLDQVGGDLFEIVPVSERILGVLIMDVSGHGVQAALVTAMLRGLVHEHEEAMAMPGELLSAINESFCSILQQGRIGSFASAFALAIDLDARVLRYSSAGHPNPLLIRAGDEKPVILDGGLSEDAGGVLGLLAGSRFVTHEIGLRPSDSVLLYTDGLFEVEVPAGGVLGEEGLRDLVVRHSGTRGHGFLDSLLDGVRKVSAAGNFRDDVCVVSVEIT